MAKDSTTTNNDLAFSAKMPKPVSIKGTVSVFVAISACTVSKADFEISETDDGAKYLTYNGDEALLRVPAAKVKEKVGEYMDNWD